ncbi:hypothetical protein [Streptomyces sp. NPDC000410]|uniref:hypothetical protein n=1 Tax=Streptomyces sp. NPDC000410 TaxID=3154254 RepID=UPI0033229607
MGRTTGGGWATVPSSAPPPSQPPPAMHETGATILSARVCPIPVVTSAPVIAMTISTSPRYSTAVCPDPP